MDEVFGNSSSETVVSVTDLDRGTEDQIISEDLHQSEASDTPDCTEERSIMKSKSETSLLENDSPDKLNEFASENVIAVSNGSTDAPQSTMDPLSNNTCSSVIRASVIKSVGETKCSSATDDHVFKIPYPPPSTTVASLRHTQSALVPRSVNDNKRPRANSANTPLQSFAATYYNPYQNLPITTQPVYMNVPKHDQESPLSPSRNPCVIQSAPSTPRDSHKTISPRINTSYIQLWTGVRQKRNFSESDSDESLDSRPSSAGYVRMSSPYVRSPSSSILSNVAHHLASYSGTESKEIFCPFCPRPFSQECNLSHHIQAIHRHELQKVICGSELMSIQHCPICEGRFFCPDVLPSHLLEFHRGDVLHLFDKYQLLDVEVNSIKCPFCIKKVPISKVGEDVLLYHLLQLHNVEYEMLIHSLFKPVPSTLKEEVLNRISNEDLAQAFKPVVTSTPGLSIKFQNLSCQFESESEASCTKANETWSSHCIDIKNLVHKEPPPIQKNKGILRSQTDLSRKPSVKRELRFSVPPVTSKEIFIPESPESSSPSNQTEGFSDVDFEVDFFQRQNIPVRIDSLSSADFIELTHHASRKRRKLGIGIKSKKCFKNKDKENRQCVENVLEGLKNVGCGKSITNQRIVTTTATRTFRKPKPVPPPTVPETARTSRSSVDNPHNINSRVSEGGIVKTSDLAEVSPFSTMRLYSPLRMFRCNRCRVKFCDNESLGTHIRCKHRGLLGFLRPQFGCGICEAKFFENKYLVKHCLQHHTSLLEIRSPNKRKITVYRLSSD